MAGGVLRSELAKAGVTRVGIEATGGYERGVVKHLRAAGFTVLVLQPIQVRAYARMHLRRAKNDALDAVLIAACTAAIEEPEIEPDARLAELADHLTFVEQIEEDIARLKTRLEHIDDPRLRRLVIADIARLKARRAAEIAADRQGVCAPMTTSPGGSISCSAFPASASAPRSRSSSACPSSAASAARKRRRSPALPPSTTTAESTKASATSPAAAGGCAAPSSPPRLPAAFRWNQALVDLYARLTARGKAHNAALIACARKLLIYANTVVQRGTPWIERPAAT